MEISKAAVGVLAGLCLAAGAGGAYIATRSGDAPAPVTAPETATISPDPAPEVGVEQSEAIVSDSAAVPERPARVVPPPAAPPVERRTPNPRPRAQATRQPVVEEAPPPAVAEEARVAIPPALEPVRTVEPEPVRLPEPPEPRFVELVVSADSVVGLQVETALTSERARVEDEVEARVTRDVRVGERVAIPAGSKAVGEVTLVERGGRMRDRARLGIRFTSIVLADGTRVPIETDTIFREGDAPGGESAAKIGGGAIGGAIIGGILGGAKGAAIGGAVGAGGGSAAVLAGGRNAATLPAGTPVTVRVEDPVTVTVERP
jgi:type IV secretory pathway VirB10-like protein